MAKSQGNPNSPSYGGSSQSESGLLIASPLRGDSMVATYDPFHDPFTKIITII